MDGKIPAEGLGGTLVTQHRNETAGCREGSPVWVAVSANLSCVDSIGLNLQCHVPLTIPVPRACFRNEACVLGCHEFLVSRGQGDRNTYKIRCAGGGCLDFDLVSSLILYTGRDVMLAVACSVCRMMICALLIVASSGNVSAAMFLTLPRCSHL
jgi:hypothetical protein